ncbi:MAG: c-type cytochrome [Opitutae bacterium]|nr:c-type cytochrome [Opitutae bacterium]MDG1300260.1 c-type cytochrome [Opitutae bacterium]
MNHKQITRKRTTALISGIALLCGLLIVSCAPTEDSPTGFILPPGDAMTGQTTFAALGCIHCHTVDGVSFTSNDDIPPKMIVKLGGKLPRVKTYGQLVTSVIHPSATILKKAEQHIDAQGDSLMPNYADLMTVQQMTDLVTFLQEHYDVATPVYDPQGLGYPYY